jgi:hypothetical protein
MLQLDDVTPPQAQFCDFISMPLKASFECPGKPIIFSVSGAGYESDYVLVSATPPLCLLTSVVCFWCARRRSERERGKRRERDIWGERDGGTGVERGDGVINRWGGKRVCVHTRRRRRLHSSGQGSTHVRSNNMRLPLSLSPCFDHWPPFVLLDVISVAT